MNTARENSTDATPCTTHQPREAGGGGVNQYQKYSSLEHGCKLKFPPQLQRPYRGWYLSQIVFVNAVTVVILVFSLFTLDCWCTYFREPRIALCGVRRRTQPLVVVGEGRLLHSVCYVKWVIVHRIDTAASNNLPNILQKMASPPH